MTQQAVNTMELYKCGNPSQIAALLRLQAQSVVDELRKHFHVTNIETLAVRLSKGSNPA